jgi:uncharacterized membrane protein (DUF485 family)
VTFCHISGCYPQLSSMRILVERTRTELLIITFVIPTLAAIISRILNFDLIDWTSIAYITAILWWLTSANYLNKQKREFDLTLSRIAGGLMIAILIVDLFIMDINGTGIERTTFITILNILFPISGFYLVFILTRIYGNTINNHDPSGLELFPNYLLFIIYPIGIWKFHAEIAKTAKT